MEEEKEVVHFNMLSRDEILEKFSKVHGYFYSYDKMVYKGIREHITITCPIHGDYTQRPSDHASGSGCRSCAGERKSKKASKPTSHFIERARFPVGVVRKYGRWYFQQIVRINNKKDKKFHGSFNKFEDCCEFARHFWATGEVLDTPKNLLFYNKFGLPKNITPCFGGYRVQLSINHVSYYVGTFPTIEEAVAAKEETTGRIISE